MDEFDYTFMASYPREIEAAFFNSKCWWFIEEIFHYSRHWIGWRYHEQP